MWCTGGKNSAVVRTQPTFVLFFTYCGTSIGYWLPFTSALAPRCSYEGWAVLSGGHFRTLRLYDSMLVCEYIDMYDRERMGDVLLPM